ncbi:hypothetical protein WOLCODRAFT_166508 [Wolfiporia cocos MD-104 SS10]|uniref:Uncharacterized protein n=1 Tax=Wolfiporia cocos (strain MD-104) TaxID=742152 RepID=A0A2H3J1I0_WOLCO|nr:hypothetical protein WOLCODRAFT_166508 [Wolfiporia cocos MD-104 SS10]
MAAAPLPLPVLAVSCLPRRFSIADCPLATLTCFWTMSKEELAELYTERYMTSRATENASGAPERAPMSGGRYSARRCSDRSCRGTVCWSAGRAPDDGAALWPGGRSLLDKGIENVTAFFERAVGVWAVQVQKDAGGAPRGVRIIGLSCGPRNAYRWNWYNWANIGEMNQVSEKVLVLLRFPGI